MAGKPKRDPGGGWGGIHFVKFTPLILICLDQVFPRRHRSVSIQRSTSARRNKIVYVTIA